MNMMKQRMHRSKLLLAVSAVLMTLLVTACSSGGSHKSQPAVQVSNPQADRYIKVGNLLHREQGGIMQFSVQVTNDANNTVQLQYKFRFYDADGFEVAPQGRPWKPLIMTGKETRNLQSVAPTSTVRYAKLFIRE